MEMHSDILVCIKSYIHTVFHQTQINVKPYSPRSSFTISQAQLSIPLTNELAHHPDSLCQRCQVDQASYP
jgi:hypothetical protein